jgi:hypothetical protein
MFAPNSGKLFKDSKGHGSMYCSACHGSPHAIYPTEQARDNEQIVALQGYPGKLSECWVCHGVDLTATGPHGISHTDVRDSKVETEIKIYPNPVHDVLFINNQENIKELKIYSSEGKSIDINSIISHLNDKEAKLNVSKLTVGTYLLKIGNRTQKFIKK